MSSFSIVGKQSRWGYLPYLLLALLTLMLLLVSVSYLRTNHYEGLKWSGGIITAIDPDGPAANVDIRVGDRILSVNGSKPPADFPKDIGQRPGQSLALELLRGNERVTAVVPVEPFDLRFKLLLAELVAIGFIYWGLSVAVWLLSPFSATVRIYFLASQSVAGMLTLGKPWMAHWPTSLTVYGLYMLLIGPVIVHLSLWFPEPAPKAKRNRLLVPVYTIAALIGIASLLLPRLGIQLAPSSTLFMLIRIYLILTLIVSIGLFIRGRSNSTLDTRRRRRLLVAGMIASFSPVLLLSFVPETLTGLAAVDYVWTLPFLVLGQITCIQALRRNDLARMDFVLNRSLVYVALGALLVCTYTLLFLGLSYLLPTPQWSLTITGLALAIIMTASYSRTRRWLQRRIDHSFYGGWYDYRSMVNRVTTELSHIHDQDQLTGNLLSVASSMHFDCATLIWVRDDLMIALNCYGCDSLNTSAWRIPHTGSLANDLTRNPQPQTLQDVLRRVVIGPKALLLTEAERDLLSAEQLNVWVPIKSKNVLRGVLMMGNRQQEALLSNDDRYILRTLASQAAIAAENIELLDTLRARLTEVEEMRDELTETRARLSDNSETERLRLAQELHDGAVQDLYGASFQLNLLRNHPGAHGDGDPIADVQNTLNEVASELRAICGELRPPALAPFGLERAIRSHASKIETRHPELTIALYLMPDGQSLPEKVRLALFRTYQEAMNNVLKHSHAQHVRVRLELRQDELILEISDDGDGFAMPDRLIELGRQGHYGLLGLQERAAALGGKLELISAPGEGTITRVVVQCVGNHSPDKSVTIRREAV